MLEHVLAFGKVDKTLMQTYLTPEMLTHLLSQDIRTGVFSESAHFLPKLNNSSQHLDLTS